MGLVIGTATWLALLVLAGMLLLGRRRWVAAARGGHLPWRVGALPVEEVAAEDAPRGWKCAQLLISPDRRAARFAGISIGCSYRADDTGTCVRHRSHHVPELSCECGFYAFFDREQAVELLGRRGGAAGGTVVRSLLEVELTGTVVEHERGYRAEHQRVLGVVVLPWCADCAGDGRLVRAAAFGTDGAPALSASEWGGLPALLGDRLHPEIRLLEEWSCLRPLCELCAVAQERRQVLSLADVAGGLGTEVRWMDPDLVPAERVLAGHRPRPPRPY